MTYSSFAKEFSQDGQTLPRLCRCGLQCLLSSLTIMTSNTSTCFFAEVSHRAVSQPPKARLGVQSPTVQDLVFTDTEPQRKSCKAQLNTTCLSRLSREPPTIYTDLILPPSPTLEGNQRMVWNTGPELTIPPLSESSGSPWGSCLQQVGADPS